MHNVYAVRSFAKAWGIALLILFLIVPASALAANPFGYSELELSSHEPSTSVNATFRLEGEAPAGEAIVFYMPGGWDLSSLVTTDFDVLDDDVQLSLADDCTGSEEASIFVGATTIFIDICTGDGGDIAAGSDIEVRIGNHATSGGTGSNQIQTPSSEASYFIQASTTTTYSSTIVVPITDPSDGSISATVPSSGGGGGGGGGGGEGGEGPAPDPEPPAEQSISFTTPLAGQKFVYGDTASIEWSTENISGTISLYRSLDGGSSWTSFATDQVDDGQYSWTVPNSSTTNAMIRLDAYEEGARVASVTSGAFEITSVIPSAIDLVTTVPNQSAPSTLAINWTKTSDITTTDVLLIDAEGAQQVLALDVPSTTTTVSFPESLETGTYTIRILGYRDGDLTVQDDSNTFTITAPEVIPDPDPEPDPTPDPNPDPTPDPDNPDPVDPDGGGGGDTGGGGSTDPSGGGDSDNGEEDVPEEVTLTTTFSSSNGVTLPLSGGTVKVLAGSAVNISTQADVFVRRATLRIDSQTINLQESFDGSFGGRFVAPSSTLPATIVVELRDGSQEVINYTVQSVGRGVVRDELTQNPISGAVATVFTVDGGRSQWDGAGQSNPVITGTLGSIGWYAPNGTYQVTAGRDGYVEGTTVVIVRDGILVPVIDLERNPETYVEEDVADPGDEEVDGGGGGAVSDAIDQVRTQVDAIAKAVNTVREIPEVQTAGEVAQPVVVATAATSVVALGSSFNLIPYLQYIFSGPLAWFARRRKRGYGTIYDADLLTPIPLVSVKLVREDGTVAGSAISDEQGHFFLRVQPGKYKLVAEKKGYNQVIEAPNKRAPIENLYTSGLIEVTESDILISPALLLSKSDAHATVNTPKRIKRRRLVRAILQAFGLSGTVLAALAFGVLQTPFSLLMVFVQLLAFALTRKLAKKASHKGWGIVQDSVKKQPVANAVVRLFDPEYNKLLETTLTDGKGRYAILAGPSEYYATVDKGGYAQQIIKPIDFSKQKEPRLVSVNVSLQPVQK